MFDDDILEATYYSNNKYLLSFFGEEPQSSMEGKEQGLVATTDLTCFFFPAPELGVRDWNKRRKCCSQTEMLPVNILCPLQSREDETAPIVTRLLFYDFFKKDFKSQE